MPVIAQHGGNPQQLWAFFFPPPTFLSFFSHCAPNRILVCVHETQVSMHTHARTCMCTHEPTHVLMSTRPPPRTGLAPSLGPTLLTGACVAQSTASPHPTRSRLSNRLVLCPHDALGPGALWLGAWGQGQGRCCCGRTEGPSPWFPSERPLHAGKVRSPQHTPLNTRPRAWPRLRLEVKSLPTDSQDITEHVVLGGVGGLRAVRAPSERLMSAALSRSGGVGGWHTHLTPPGAVLPLCTWLCPVLARSRPSADESRRLGPRAEHFCDLVCGSGSDPRLPLPGAL